VKIKLLVAALILGIVSLGYGQSADTLQKHVSTLTMQNRVTGTEGCKAARLYLEQKLIEMGYEVKPQGFKSNGWVAHNLLATKKGPLDSVLVIGAHYDAVTGSPGADDNASGTAMVLMLAEMLKNQTTRHTISFQLYAGEEQGLIGSNFYCKNPLWPIDKHLFMLNFDMVGFLNSTEVTIEQAPPVDDILKPLFQKYAYAQKITLRGGDDSDHASFLAKGIPVVFLHTGLHAYYHKKTDTPDRLNYKGMEDICRYAYDLLIAVDKHDTPQYSLLEGLAPYEKPN
jgi:acetylornithine deacetylase/succinyl-diaminopimelate desuccinylase-like protein